MKSKLIFEDVSCFNVSHAAVIKQVGGIAHLQILEVDFYNHDATDDPVPLARAVSFPPQLSKLVLSGTDFSFEGMLHAFRSLT